MLDIDLHSSIFTILTFCLSIIVPVYFVVLRAVYQVNADAEILNHKHNTKKIRLQIINTGYVSLTIDCNCCILSPKLPFMGKLIYQIPIKKLNNTTIKILPGESFNLILDSPDIHIKNYYYQGLNTLQNNTKIPKMLFNFVIQFYSIYIVSTDKTFINVRITKDLKSFLKYEYNNLNKIS